MLRLADGKSVWETVYDWLHAFVLDGKNNSETYRAFLGGALAALPGHHILIQDNASYYTVEKAHTALGGNPTELTSLAGEYRELTPALP